MARLRAGGDAKPKVNKAKDIADTKAYQSWYKKTESRVMKKDPSIQTRNELTRANAQLKKSKKKKKDKGKSKSKWFS